LVVKRKPRKSWRTRTAELGIAQFYTRLLWCIRELAGCDR